MREPDTTNGESYSEGTKCAWCDREGYLISNGISFVHRGYCYVESVKFNQNQEDEKV